MRLAAGQRWVYAAPAESPASRIGIGALVEFEGGRRIACCWVTGALEARPDGTLHLVTIPFLPIAIDALERTVLSPDGEASPPEEFAGHLSAWSEDPRGASYFTVPFEGSLDRMIALQMSAIVGKT